MIQLIKKRHILFLFTVVLALSSWGQSTDDFFKTDTIRKSKNIQFVAVPIVFYTPETDVGFGAGGQLFLLNKKNIYNNRVSNIFFDGIYTTNKQIIFDVLPQIYFRKGDMFLDMSYKFKIYPNKFWGIGNDTPNSNEEFYDMTSNMLKVSLLKRLPPSLNFGFEYIYENHEVTETQEGGLLDNGEILGSDRAIISGFGVIFNLDSRDNTGSPISGELLKMEAQFSSELLGSTQSYNKFILDLRTYRSLAEKSIIALQLYYQGNFGDPPFQGLASYGGSNTARGYFQGRFIDKQMYVVQAEYRYRFHPRWAVNGFGLFGEVADEPKDFFNFNQMKPSYGGGIRFKILKDQDTWVRADLGRGIKGSNGFYFGINEAF